MACSASADAGETVAIRAIRPSPSRAPRNTRVRAVSRAGIRCVRVPTASRAARQAFSTESDVLTSWASLRRSLACDAWSRDHSEPAKSTRLRSIASDAVVTTTLTLRGASDASDVGRCSLSATGTTCVFPSASSRSIHVAESCSRSVTTAPAISRALTRQPAVELGISSRSASMMPPRVYVLPEPVWPKQSTVADVRLGPKAPSTRGRTVDAYTSAVLALSSKTASA
eukprot:scaffold21986_cov30-Tisochrysis_lutea.AAC.6